MTPLEQQLYEALKEALPRLHLLADTQHSTPYRKTLEVISITGQALTEYERIEKIERGPIVRY